MNLSRTAAAVALGAIFSTAALAQHDAGYGQRGARFEQRGAGFEQRDAQNLRRIEQGLRTGQLTHREAIRLQHAQARIDQMEAIAFSDGRITPREIARIEGAQDELSRAIFAEKRDGHRRF